MYRNLLEFTSSFTTHCPPGISASPVLMFCTFHLDLPACCQGPKVRVRWVAYDVLPSGGWKKKFPKHIHVVVVESENVWNK